MTDDDKLLVESLRGGETTALGRGYAADRIEALTAENERLREANYAAFTDGMEAAAEICGSLAELEYDDADGFEAATGCEAAIMRVVKHQRAEQARAALGDTQ